jgi:predicted NUDIX family NTP pyrophosphohydrolase
MDAIAPPPPPDDSGVSIGEFAERHGLSIKGARLKLGKLEKEGKLVMGYRRSAIGTKMMVFRPK